MARKKPSGGASMVAAGKQPVQLWFTPEKLARLRCAAGIDGRPSTQFLIHYGLAQAEKILKKSGKSG